MNPCRGATITAPGGSTSTTVRGLDNNAVYTFSIVARNNAGIRPQAQIGAEDIAVFVHVLQQGDDRRFPPFDRFAQFRESEGKALAELLDEFESLRAANLATLAGWRLTEESLALEGEHPAFGPVTLRQLLATWVVHDLGHVAQCARVMAKQYRDAIGPWREYLPIVDR